MRKKEEIIIEFVTVIFVIASILSAFFAGIFVANATMSFILLFIAAICGLIRVSYDDDEEIKEE